MAVFMHLEPWWLYVLFLSLQFILSMTIDYPTTFRSGPAAGPT